LSWSRGYLPSPVWLTAALCATRLPGRSATSTWPPTFLVCLGKRFDALRFGRAQRRAWELVDVWIQAEGIRHLFMLRAHRLAVPLCEMLVDLARRCRVDAWLIFGPSTGRAQLPEQLPFRRWSQASFLARWDTTANGGPGKGQSGEFPELPADDFPTFRSACRRVLDAADFERVDGVFCAAMVHTAGWLKPHTRRRSGSAGDSLDLGAVAAQIQELLCDSRSALEDLVEVSVASCVMPGDDLRVEAAIAAFPAGVTRDDLARCFLWPLERVERAIAVLELRLRPSGRRLRRIGWHRYALGPNLSLLSPQEHAELARAVARQRGTIDEESALVLHQVIDGWAQARLYRDVQETVDDSSTTNCSRSGMATSSRRPTCCSALVSKSH
jgi:hypothetical protein